MRLWIATALALTTCPATAVVGPSSTGGRFAAQAIMVLKTQGGRAGFCSGVVVAPDAILTAAHCAGDKAHMRVHFRDRAGKPVLIEVADVAVHPGFRANAQKTRERTVDLALIRSARPLPAFFVAATLDDSGSVALGDTFLIAGYGVARFGAGETSGTLRTGELATRAPLSKVLLWAKDTGGSGTGACTGDSGAPIFDATGSKVIAITAWADGKGKAFCGSLTQGTLVAPHRAWIAEVLRRWGE